MHTLCRIVFFVCAALYLCAAAVDKWVILETHQRLITYNLTTATMTYGENFTKQTESYGLFTAEIRGAASLQTDWTHVMIDCHQGLDTLLNMKPSGTCTNQCIAKKALVVLACALAWFGLFVVTDTNDGFKTVESIAARRIGASFVFFSAIAGMIVLAFLGASMTESSTLTEGNSGIYGADMGICAYKVGTNDKLVVSEASDPGYGPSFILATIATLASGISSVCYFVFWAHNHE